GADILTKCQCATRGHVNCRGPVNRPREGGRAERFGVEETRHGDWAGDAQVSTGCKRHVVRTNAGAGYGNISEGADEAVGKVDACSGTGPVLRRCEAGGGSFLKNPWSRL